MNRNIKLKSTLRYIISESQIKRANFFIISFIKIDNNNKFNLTKKQFNKGELKKTINSEKLKFPLEINIFESEKQLEKEKGSFMKSKEYIFLKKKEIKMYSLNTEKLYNNLLKKFSCNKLFDGLL